MGARDCLSLSHFCHGGRSPFSSPGSSQAPRPEVASELSVDDVAGVDERVAHGHEVVHLVRVAGQAVVAGVLAVRGHDRVGGHDSLVDGGAGRDRLHHAPRIVDLGDGVVPALLLRGGSEVAGVVVRQRRHREDAAGLHVEDDRPHALGLVVEAPLHEDSLDLVLDVVVDREVHVVARTRLRAALAQAAELAAVRVLPPHHAPGRSLEMALEALLEAGRADGVRHVAAHEPDDLREVPSLRVHAHDLLRHAQLVDLGKLRMDRLVLVRRQEHVAPPAPRVLRVGVHHLRLRQVQRRGEVGDVRPPDGGVRRTARADRVLVAGLGVNRVFPHDLRAGVRHARGGVDAPAHGDGVAHERVDLGGRRIIETKVQHHEAHDQHGETAAQQGDRKPEPNLFAVPRHSPIHP